MVVECYYSDIRRVVVFYHYGEIMDLLELAKKKKEEEGVSYTWMARRAGLTLNNFSDILYGRYRPGPKKKEAIAKVFNLPVSDLFEN